MWQMGLIFRWFIKKQKSKISPEHDLEVRPAAYICSPTSHLVVTGVNRYACWSETTASPFTNIFIILILAHALCECNWMLTMCVSEIDIRARTMRAYFHQRYKIMHELTVALRWHIEELSGHLMRYKWLLRHVIFRSLSEDMNCNAMSAQIRHSEQSIKGDLSAVDTVLLGKAKPHACGVAGVFWRKFRTHFMKVFFHSSVSCPSLHSS